MKRLQSRVFVFACVGFAQAAVWTSPSVAGQGQQCETPGACVYTITCSGPAESRVGTMADIQTAVKTAHRGDTIKLEAGCTWSTSTQNAVMLDNPPGSEGYVTITTTEDDKLPNPGTRITPAYLPVMPRLVLKGSTGAFFHLSSSHEGSPTRTPGLSASHWRFTGLAFFVETDFAAGGDITRGVIGAGGSAIWSGNGTGLTSLSVSGGVATIGMTAPHLLKAGDVFGLYGTTQQPLHGIRTVASTPDNRTLTFAAAGVPDGLYISPSVYIETPPSEDYLPDDIVIDRIITTQSTWMGIVRRMLNIHARRVTIRDSFLEGAQHNGSDSQTIGSSNGSGPYTIENNYIGSASENIMFGGSAQTINKPNTDSVIRFNYLPHPPERYWTLRWKFLRGKGIGKDGLVFKGRHVRPNTGTSVYIATTTGYIGDSEPDWSQCETGTSCTVQDGGVTWRRFGAAHWVIKNNFEIKGAKNTLLSHNVFEYMWFAGQETSINIKAETQTKFPTYMNNCVPTTIGTVSTNGNQVTRVSGLLPYQYAVSNTWSVPGKQITINGIPYQIASFDTADSLTLTSDAGVQTNVPSHYGAPLTSPCMPDWNHSTQFVHNIIRNTSRPFKITPGGQARKDMSVGLVVRNNLMTDIDAVYWHNHDGTPYASGTGRNYLFGLLPENTIVEHNTFDGENAVVSVYFGDEKGGGGAVFRYNIWPAGTTAGLQTGQYQPGGGGNLFEHAAMVRDLCDGMNPCPKERWDGNVFAGGNLATFTTSPGRVWNLCGTTLPFLPACGATNANWDLLYPGRSKRNYRVNSDKAEFKQMSVFGQDIGADTDQLAEIRELNVTPTDRMVLFTWKITEPVKDIPCVTEVNTSPDMDPATYAAELAQIGAWPRFDSDDHDRNPRSGLERSIVIGHTVNLTPETQYFYRLQCGGDTRTGSFQTIKSRSQDSERKITYTASNESTASIEVEYGTAYSRSADGIGNGGSVAEPCTSGGNCTVRLPLPAGSVIYYRVKEKNGAGEVLGTSGPHVIADEK